MQAEAAEREADRALFAARAAVRDAKENVRRLEREAAEEARQAKIKQSQAKAIGKRGKALGRKYSGVCFVCSNADELFRPWLSLGFVTQFVTSA
jgi:hypothetical protein